MTDLFNTPDRSNKAVLASTADITSQLAAQRAHDLHRQDRKVNAGAPAQAKPTTPWYRRFDKR